MFAIFSSALSILLLNPSIDYFLVQLLYSLPQRFLFDPLKVFFPIFVEIRTLFIHWSPELIERFFMVVILNSLSGNSYINFIRSVFWSFILFFFCLFGLYFFVSSFSLPLYFGIYKLEKNNKKPATTCPLKRGHQRNSHSTNI